LRAVASGLMIEKVRSIAIALFFKEGRERGVRFAAAYSERAEARQGVTQVGACNQGAVWPTSWTANSRRSSSSGCTGPPDAHPGAAAIRTMPLSFNRRSVEPRGWLVRLTGRMCEHIQQKKEKDP